MNAIELAERLESGRYLTGDHGSPLQDAAAMLRKQAEAIKTLREALKELSGMYVVHHNAATRAKAALAATEELK